MSERLRSLAPSTPQRGALDFPLLTAVVILMGLGAVMVYSATINEMTHTVGDGAAKLKTHLIHMTLAFGVMFSATLFPYRRLKNLTYPALFTTFFLLILVIAIGIEAGNARRWLALPGGFNFQPAELAKLVFVLFLSYSITKKGSNIRRFSVAFIPHSLVAALLVLLCLFQPDFGTSVILVLIMFAMLLVAGTRMSYIVLLSFGALFLGIQAIISNDMRMGRLMATFDPWAHRHERGFQIVNSQIAIGSGEISGQGLGYGGQTLTGFLPEGETDFIFSVLAEQLGTLGVLFVITCFIIILWRGMRLALDTKDHFARMLAFGLTVLLILEAAINMLVAVAIIPTKGLTLPFVSYGGSSMLISAAAVGILLNISRTHHLNPDHAPRPRRQRDTNARRFFRRRRQQPRSLYPGGLS